MRLDSEALELLTLLLIALFLGRFGLCLGKISKRVGTRKTKLGLVAFAALIPMGWLMSNQLHPTHAARSLSLGMGLIWMLGLIPSRKLTPSHRSQDDLAITPLTKGSLCFLFGFIYFVPAVFAPLYTLVFFLLRGRFRYISITELFMPHAVSVLLCAYFCISIFLPISDQALFVGLVSTAGAQYFFSGIKKFSIGWGRANVLGNIAIAAQTQNNWRLIAGTTLLRRLIFLTGWISQPVVIVIEIVALFCFVDWRMTFIVFTSLLVMHLMIFITTGIFFWKWMGTLAIVLIAGALISPTSLISHDAPNFVAIFAMSVVIPFFSSPMITLAWFDSPVSKNMRFLLCSQEQRVCLNPYDVAPLDMLLSQARQETYFFDGMHAFDCFGSNYDRESAIELNQLSADRSLSINEKKQQALAILSKIDLTKLNRQTVRDETSLLLNQLRFNLEHRPRFEIRNNHIWNARPRANPDLTHSIIQSPSNCRVIVERDIYFYCRRKNISILLDQRSVEISVGVCPSTGTIITDVDFP